MINVYREQAFEEPAPTKPYSYSKVVNKYTAYAANLYICGCLLWFMASGVATWEDMKPLVYVWFLVKLFGPSTQEKY